MSKWARVVNEMVAEVVDYNPFEVVNEAFHYQFHECGDEVEVGYTYDEDTLEWEAPAPIPEPEAVGIAST